MRPWVQVDDDLVAKVQHMVVQALGQVKSWEMALEVTRQAMQWADGLIEAFESVNPLPRPVACQPGCTYCCHNQVEATPPEVFAIAMVTARYLPPPKLERLKEKALRMAAFKVGKTKAELAASRKSQPCPLLEGDKMCAVPLAALDVPGHARSRPGALPAILYRRGSGRG